jgi:hypothetical protein
VFCEVLTRTAIKKGVPLPRLEKSFLQPDASVKADTMSDTDNDIPPPLGYRNKEKYTPLPTSIPPVHVAYAPGQRFTLNTQDLSSHFSGQLEVVVRRHVPYRDGPVTQKCIAQVVGGRTQFLGREVFVIVYDPVYVPEEIFMPAYEGTKAFGVCAKQIEDPYLFEESKHQPNPDRLGSEDIKNFMDSFPPPADIVNSPPPPDMDAKANLEKVPKRPLVLETRHDYVQRFWARELQTYNSLGNLQGSQIPLLYGRYSLEFPDRPSVEDRNPRVLVFELLKGTPLDEVPVEKLSAYQKKAICSQVLQLQENMRRSDIYWPTVYADNYILLEGDATEIRGLDFSNTVEPPSNETDREDFYNYQVMLTEMFLGELGYRVDIERETTEEVLKKDFTGESGGNADGAELVTKSTSRI